MLNIQVFHKFSISLNEVLAQFHFGAHQFIKDCIGLFGILNLHLHQHAP